MTRPTCDFLIIGAGVAGVCLAADLAQAGHSVTVLDANQLCGGSSGLNAGGLRQQFTQEINVRMAKASVERVEAITAGGTDVGHHQVGYLFLVTKPATVEPLQAAVRMQAGCGVPTTWLSPREILALVPAIVVDDVLGATFCPTDGYLDPVAVVQEVATQARASGARIRQFSRVVAIETARDRVGRVRLANGDELSAGTVVNCAGAWSTTIAKLYGASLPVLPWRSQCFTVSSVPGLPRDFPVTIDFQHGKTWMHPDGANILCGTDIGAAVDASWHVPFDSTAVGPLVERLVERVPAMQDTSIIGGWAGLLELTADENPIADWTHFDNLYTLAGFSGHGICIAPGLTPHVARQLTGEPGTLDLHPYAFERFTEGVAATEILAMR